MNIQDMKCCGNCVYREAVDYGDRIEECCTIGLNTKSFKYCSDWEYDTMGREDRKI